MIIIKGIELGAGIPKICVPIIEKTKEDIIQEARRISATECSVVEWRIDFYNEVFDKGKVVELLPGVSKAVGSDKILLVTFRTKNEGGQEYIEADEYKNMLMDIMDSGYADIVDIELSVGEEIFKELVDKASAKGCYVIASSHDFEKTPACDEMVNKLVRMKELGAHISKLAVMPNCMEDVANLLRATSIIKDKYSHITAVTMSMGSMGMISRLAGEVFGSAMTFGILDKPSAPGQVKVSKLRQIMTDINEL